MAVRVKLLGVPPLSHAGVQKPGRSPGLFADISPAACRGFTTIELIVVVVIAGILAAVVLPRWSGGGGFDERALRDETLAALRHAQKSAIAARRTVCANFPSNLQVDFRISTLYGAADCSAGSPLPAPEGGALVVTGHNGASYSAYPAGIVFDAQGRPAGGSASIAVGGLAASLTLTVEAETGYVH